MAIEGPLRELGIHDVFQLLDLSRKTGHLHVRSALRDNAGTVYFDRGRVVAAVIRSNPHPIGVVLLRSGKIGEADLERARAMQETSQESRRLGEYLVEIGAITRRELERQVRRQVEAVIFELMSWQEGFFSFVDEPLGDIPVDALVSITTESLLMEGARRIDEWSMITQRIPSLGMIPLLATDEASRTAHLDLLPNEWEVLAAIDGETDLRMIAQSLGRSEFDVAKIAFGLLATSVIEISAPILAAPDLVPAAEDAPALMKDAIEAMQHGDHDVALVRATAAVMAAPALANAHVVLSRALAANGRATESFDALQRALELDPDSPMALMAVARNAVAQGALPMAIKAWERAAQTSPDSSAATLATHAIALTAQLTALLEQCDDV